MRKLIIITESYPFSISKEDTFIEPEIRVLSRIFQITLVPLSNQGIRLECPVGVNVVTDYADRCRLGKATLILRSPILIFDFNFWKEITSNLKVLKSLVSIKYLAMACLKRKSLRDWLFDYQEKNKCFQDAIVYTYWFGPETAAVLDFGCKTKLRSVITRSHRGDLYSELRPCSHIPFRKKTIEKIDKVFLISAHGYEYLLRQYPLYSSKYYLSPLGIEDRGISITRSNDGIFRLVSCSYISPVKRVELTAQVIATLARLIDEKIEWFHIGGGDGMSKIEKMVKDIFPINASAFFLGSLENKKIFEFYKSQPLDLFVMFSESEGKPVALMEALSVSLPVVASNVGGIPELVFNGINGYLFDVDESVDVISAAIARLVDNPELNVSMGKESRKIWQKTSSAAKNFNTFASELMF